MTWIRSSNKAGLLGVFTGERLAAALADFRFDLWLNGALVKANGIGAVASAPETRRRGLVRTLLADHLRRLRAEGVVLSVLYPFKFEFYRRMGWGLAARLAEVEIPPAEFAAYGRPLGRIRRVLSSEKGELRPAPGETVESVRATLERIFNAWAPELNLCCRRGPEEWRVMFEMRRGRRHIFLWEDDHGDPQGYVALRIAEDQHMTDLRVREMFALTPDAWRGLCHFLSTHEAQNRNIVATLPPDHPLLTVLANPRLEQVKLVQAPMARVVDVVGLLSTRGHKDVPAGTCRLKVNDRLAPWNDGVYLVRSSGRGVTVEKVPAGEAGFAARARASGPAAGERGPGSVDLEVDVDALAGLAIGARSVRELLRYGLAAGRPGPGLEFAADLFPRRRVWHSEFY